MNLLTGALLAALRRNNADRGADHIPLVKFFVPWGAGTWIITEMEDDGDTLFGLAEIHEPELGYSSLAELEGVRGPGGLRIERDLWFRTDKPLSVWTAAARRAGRIVDPE